MKERVRRIKKYYMQKKIENYKKRKRLIISSEKNIRGVAIRKWLHPLLIKILRVKSVLLGMTYEIIGHESNISLNETVLYAITHIGKSDYEMIVEACNIFAYPFAGDWETMYATIDDYFLRINGVLYVDTGDKEDRKNSFQYMVKALKQGIPMLIFPEGIWNLTENLPMMKIYPGAVQAAKECSVPIIPIAVEQREKHFIINVGKKLLFENIEDDKAVQILRDTLASLKWTIWEHLPQEKRKDIPMDYFEKFVDERIAECNGIDLELIHGRIYRDKFDRELLAIKQDLDGLKKKVGSC